MTATPRTVLLQRRERSEFFFVPLPSIHLYLVRIRVLPNHNRINDLFDAFIQIKE